MKQKKWIYFLFYSSIIWIWLIIIFLSIFIALLATPNNVGNPFSSTSEDPTYKQTWLVITILLIISVIFTWIFELLNGIFILSISWDTKIIPDKSTKILWGVLTIIPLGLFASLTFSIIGMKNLKKYSNQA